MATAIKTKRLDPWRVEVVREGDMRAPGLVFADEALMAHIFKEEALKQVANVARLPGIVGRSLAMPDIHWGYGFAIGGVAAFDLDDGVISPGGVGYDINCGVRLIRTDLAAHEVQPWMRDLVEGLYRDVPTGLGSKGALKLGPSDLRKVLVQGAAWVVGQGLGTDEDLDHTEDRGAMDGADPDAVSDRALERGLPQVGTLGSGNHFLEVARVDEVFDAKTAHRMGLFEGQITVMVHSGSRGLGHQVCDDFLKVMGQAARRHQIQPPDRQLACAPVNSEEGRRYFAAMAAAANYAWANRQAMTAWVRDSFQRTFELPPRDLNMRLVYDVAHNIAKIETHRVDGQTRRVMVHRKGATRAFAPGRPEIPDDYRDVGQPVLIPGDMGTASYVMAGDQGAMEESFGSCCHGAGRVMSRSGAKKRAKGRRIDAELAEKGVVVRSAGYKTLIEEMPEAYKDVSQVVEVVHQAGLARKVVRLRPMGVVKG
jgi:tRNA-splicing ligase RtcB